MTANARPYALESLTYSIIGCFLRSHSKLQSGFLESVYAAALARELRKIGLHYARELRVPVYYDGEPIAWQRLDFVVEEQVVLELKSTTNLPPDSTRQLYNYLRATGLQVGLLLHYGKQAHAHRVYCEHAHAQKFASAPEEGSG